MYSFSAKAGIWSIFGLALLVLLTMPALARPQVLIVLADHLTLSDLTRPDLPNLSWLCAYGQLSLMSPGRARAPDPIANAYATLGAGDDVRQGEISQGLMGRALAEAHLRIALIGNADGDDTGSDQSALLFLPAPDTISTIGTVPDPIVCGGRRIAPALLWTQTQIALNQSALVVVRDGDFARCEHENRAGLLLPSAYSAQRQSALQRLDQYLGLARPYADGSHGTILYIAVPVPPMLPNGMWDQLTPFLRYQGNENTGSLGKSDTTQTLGLVAARDLAPTVLADLQVPIPIQMVGAPIQSISMSASRGMRVLQRLDLKTTLNSRAENPVFWSLGIIGSIVALCSITLYLSGVTGGSQDLKRVVLYFLRAFSAWPLALLVASLFDPASLKIYLGEIALLIFLLALLPSPSVIYGLSALIIVADGLTGTHLVSQSVLSEYALSGIRFYGIGNEYMGVLIAGSLLAAGGVKASQRSQWGILVWFILATLVLSFPAFGAKAGGAITATATFTLAWLGLRGVPLKLRHGIFGIAAGFGLVFFWAALDHLLPIRRTHIDTAVGALGQGRFGYIIGVTLRKIGLGLHVFLHPGTLLGLLGLFLIGLAFRLLFWRRVTEYLSSRQSLTAVMVAGLWGSVIAVFFNDSGLVAAILLLCSLVLCLLHGLIQESSCESLPSMSAKSGSVSPSATA